MYVQGVSTRKVRAVTEDLCGHSFSASTVSAITVQLDAELERFITRPLNEEYASCPSQIAIRDRSTPACSNPPRPGIVRHPA